MLFATTIAIAVAIVLVLWALAVLKSLSAATTESLSLIRRVDAVVTDTVKPLALLSADFAAQAHSQKVAFTDLVDRLEKAADREMFGARQVASDLHDREEKVDTDLAAREEFIDTAREGVAEDLAAAKHRADETVGEPGAAADAAVKTPAEEDDSG